MENIFEKLGDILNPQNTKTMNTQDNTLEIQEMKEEYSQDKERLNMDDARRYVPLIPRIEGETYKETSERLSGAIGKGIDKDVFHKAVKLIRTKTL